MTIQEFKRRMEADGWNVRKVLDQVFEVSANRVPTFHVTFAEIYPLTDIGLLIAEKLRPDVLRLLGQI
jgi:hypothetical protein